MIDRFYREELAHLKELAQEFAEAHPALASMLGGAAADPDVERLFQGMALQFALLRQKIDDDFPEFIHPLTRQLCPQFLRPVPSATIVAFSPQPTFIESRAIPAGTQLASVPVEGTSCQFRTCSTVELHPLELLDAAFTQAPAAAPAISLSLALTGVALADWSVRSLRLFLAGDYAAASDLYLLLRRYLRRIVITPEEGGQPAVLPPESLSAAGFRPDEAVIPYPPNTFPGYRFLQEFFTIPQRFLFLDLVGWEKWTERGKGTRFRVTFELAPSTLSPPQVRRESFALFATPAVNLFPADARPIVLDHRKDRYPVRPDVATPEHAAVFSIDGVTGLLQGAPRERRYLPAEGFPAITATEPAYRTAIVTRPAREGFDVYLSFSHAEDDLFQQETISVALTCTNGRLAESLRVGDLCQATPSSPQGVSFRNLTQVTHAVMPPLGKELLWRLVSHQSLNRQALASAGQLREILELYLFEEEGSDQAALAASRKRINAIKEMTCQPTQRLVRGSPVRGTEMRITVNGDHFAGPGDLFLFGSVLDDFLSTLATINTFTQLTVQESSKGETLEWPPRLGDQPLL